jgi:hypothetical protein
VVGNYYGCLDSATVSVTVLPLHDTACNDTLVFQGAYYPIYGIVTNSSFSGTNFYISGDLYVNGGTNVNLGNKVLMMAPGATIYVYGNASLSLNNCHLFSCPASIHSWRGISLQGSASLYLGGNTMIEYADTAVRIEGTVSPASGFSYVFYSDTATFNRNYAGIELSRQATPDNILVRNTVFTSRDFIAYNDSSTYSYPKVWPPVMGSDGLKTAYTPASGYLPPYNIDNPAAVFGTFPYPPALRKTGDTAMYGIVIDSVGSTDLTTSPPNVTAEVQIGDNSSSKYQNQFDNLKYGIHGSYSNLSSVNNAFLRNGIGVYAESFINPCIMPVNQSFFARLRVWDNGGTNHNRFYDCGTGAEANSMFQFTGQKAFMISNHNTANPYGNIGYNVHSWYMSAVDMSYDTIVNITNGIILNTLASAGNEFLPNAAISHNEIRASLPGEAYKPNQHPNYFADYGIQAMNVLPFPLNNGGGYGQISINSNRLMDVYHGIYASDQVVEKASSNLNNIVLVSDTFQASQYGIWHAHCIGDSVFENPNIHGLNIWNSTNADNVRAFQVSSSNPIISCNWEDSVGRGFEFSGTCSGTSWFNNTLDTNLEGLYLNNGLIDTQGASGSPIGDNWDVPAYWSGSNLNTYVNGYQAASASALYVLGVTPYDPLNNSALATIGMCLHTGAVQI